MIQDCQHARYSNLITKLHVLTMVRASTRGVSSTRGVVAVSLTVGSRWHVENTV